MPEQYFRKVPNFQYISRNSDEKNIDDYVIVKNLFKRGKIREDILEDTSYFDQYNIVGDERPDNVANKYYKDSSLDWLVLLSNNILNIQSEWPLIQQDFDEIMLEKYGSYDHLYNGVHHYEADEVKNSLNQILIKQGTILPQFTRDYRRYLSDGNLNPDFDNLVPYFIEYFDPGREEQILSTGFVKPVTNFEYENRMENAKRTIFLLKKQFVNIVLEDLDNILPYKKGSEQYISRTLKIGDNIKLWN